MKIKKGDTITIKKGKDAGKSGKVASVSPSVNKVTVHGLNQVKKTVRPKKMGEKGQIVAVSAPLAVSNVMLVCPSCGKETRIGMRIEGKDKKRFCKRCNSVI
ncbi:MAG: 50S ribosomal protein L24 [Candidatus Colwellbacteria bacterium]|nr:50S ribosomal protein L24 [Candidatus Colwellbacteria bacterium]